MDIRHFSSQKSTSSHQSPRVLFFGRKKCEGTKKALSHLLTLGFEVDLLLSERMGESLSEDISWWSGEYIFCFRSYFILPKYLFKKAQIAAINFHPAPAEYPGSGCLNFALYENSTQYGVTAHLINEKVDNGAIVRCQRFTIHENDTINSLLTRTHHHLLGLFFDITSGIAIDGMEFIQQELDASKGDKWRGEAKKMSELNSLKKIDSSITKEELRRRVRAAHTDEYPLILKINGYKFTLASIESDEAQ
ncbi:MAG: hypothetical protein HRT36_00705 [Alphaproteobacteria bacterium]|nr:hypothetical protein [Alphaproteobacteria bacterium]